MKNTAFSLMTALLAVMNESEPKDPYYVLAQYFLYHFDQLRDLNIYDVADACYVSRSGIRRFCQSIGFDNFSDLLRPMNGSASATTSSATACVRTTRNTFPAASGR